LDALKPRRSLLEGKAVDPPTANAILSGKVLEVEKRKNEFTGTEYLYVCKNIKRGSRCCVRAKVF